MKDVAVKSLFNRHADGKAGAILLEDAIRIFDRIADAKDISFGYLREGCYARTHIMCQKFLEQGLTPQKAWAFPVKGKFLSTELSAHLPLAPEWEYHVAPVLKVRLLDGKEQDMVFDPSLFDGPAFLSEWGSAMKADPQNVHVVSLGEAPPGHKGSYQPDIPDSEYKSIDDAAVDTIYEFLECQPESARIVLPSFVRRQLLKQMDAPLRGKTWLVAP